MSPYKINENIFRIEIEVMKHQLEALDVLRPKIAAKSDTDVTPIIAATTTDVCDACDSPQTELTKVESQDEVEESDN